MKAIIEGLLFLSGEDGLTLDEMTNITNTDKETIKAAIKDMFEDYKSADRGIQIEFLGNHFKLTTKSEHKDYYKKLKTIEENSPLSQTALETLAIIAYNGPITRMDIDNLRGVNSSYVIRKLFLKGLIEGVGKADTPGKPRLYNITPKFLDYFGLGSIDELPKIEVKEENNNNDTNLFESKYTEDFDK